MAASVSGERQWVRVRSLPIELQLEVRGLAGSQPLRPPGAGRIPILVAAIVIGAGCLAFGISVARSVPGGPWDNLLRSAPLMLGGGVLGGWLGWLLTGAQRPERGPVVFLSQTAVIRVEDVAVEVIPAETLSIEGGRLIADRALGDAPLAPEFITRAATAIARAQDPSQREADPWRQVATASGQDAAIAVSPVLPAAGVVLGLVVAFLIDQGLGATPIATEARIWRRTAGEGDMVTRVVDRLGRGAYGGLDRAAADADSALEAVGVFERRRELELPPSVAKTIDDRLVELVSAELGAAARVSEVAPLLVALARQPQLPPGLDVKVRSYVAAHAGEMRAIDSLAEFGTGYVEAADAFGDAEARAAMRARLVELVRRDLAAARTLEQLPTNLIGDAERLALGDDYRAAVRDAHSRVAGEVARTGSFADVRAVLVMMIDEAPWLADPGVMRRLRQRYVVAGSDHIAALPLLDEVDNILAEAERVGVAPAGLASLRKHRLRAARAAIERAATADDLTYAVSLWPSGDDAELARVIEAAVAARVEALIRAGASGAELDKLRSLGGR